MKIGKHTDYRGYQENDQVIQWFWKCINEWDSEQKARLLQFTTGTSRIPVNGFKDLQGSDGPRRFTIEKLVKLINCPNLIHVSIELIYHLILIMKV